MQDFQDIRVWHSLQLRKNINPARNVLAHAKRSRLDVKVGNQHGASKNSRAKSSANRNPANPSYCGCGFHKCDVCLVA
jgi:hypothetical protein